MSLFRKDVNEEGVEVLVEVDLAEIDIPKEVIIANKEYKKLADRDYKRRKQIEALKKQAEGAGAEEPVEAEVEAGTEEVVVQVVQPVAPVLNEDELFEKFTTRLTEKQLATQAAAKAEQEKLNALIEKHLLTPDALAILQKSTDPELVAQLLENSTYRFDDTIGGAPSPERTDDELGSYQGTSFSKVMDKMGMSDKK